MEFGGGISDAYPEKVISGPSNNMLTYNRTPCAHRLQVHHRRRLCREAKVSGD